MKIVTIIRYGLPMTQSLPYAGFAFLTKEEIATFDVMAVATDSCTGFILEVRFWKRIFY